MKLAEITFHVTNVGAGTTTIAFTSTSTPAGYGFVPTPYDMPLYSFVWDFDKNGNVDALTDGLLFLRYLFGLRGDN